MTKRNLLLIEFILIILAGVILLYRTVPYLRIAPWAQVKPPYFEYSMGEIYKEVPPNEAKKQVSFKIYQPEYLPAGLPPYKTALRIRPLPLTEVSFFTPEFPGVKPGPLHGVRISEATIFNRGDLLLKDVKNVKIGETIVRISGSDGVYLEIFLKIEETEILVMGFGSEANQSELIKVAESLLLK